MSPGEIPYNDLRALLRGMTESHTPGDNTNDSSPPLLLILLLALIAATWIFGWIILLVALGLAGIMTLGTWIYDRFRNSAVADSVKLVQHTDLPPQPNTEVGDALFTDPLLAKTALESFEDLYFLALRLFPGEDPYRHVERMTQEYRSARRRFSQSQPLSVNFECLECGMEYPGYHHYFEDPARPALDLILGADIPFRPLSCGVRSDVLHAGLEHGKGVPEALRELFHPSMFP